MGNTHEKRAIATSIVKYLHYESYFKTFCTWADGIVANEVSTSAQIKTVEIILFFILVTPPHLKIAELDNVVTRIGSAD